MSSSSGYKILIDGYNVIKRNPRQFPMPLESARRKLIHEAAHAKWSVPVDTIKIVFDAREGEPSQQSPAAKVLVFFVPDADAEIQREIRLKQPRQRYLLISEDAELRGTAKSHGVAVHSVSWFLGLSSASAAPARSASSKEDAPKISAASARKITQELTVRWLNEKK